MSVARHNFIERVSAVEDALTQPLLIDKNLTDAAHNNRARILRNGLMVVTFSGLEDFIRERSAEVLNFVSRTSLRFDDLPRDLAVAATVEAMRAAHSRALMASRQGDDPIPILQGAAAEVASTLQGPLSISKYALGYAGSNIGAEEVSNILKTLHAADPWNEITLLGSRVGLGSTPLRDAYAQGLRLRNQAAHRADTNIQPTELLTFCQQAKAIALGFDLLASRAARLLHDSTQSFAQQTKNKLSQDISIIFVDHDGRHFVSKRENVGRALKREADETAAWLYAVSKARPKFEAIVLRNKSGTPTRWESTDCA
ncbi:hypothetical protein AB0F72_28595 [Actinoplanes sp. NPDC023936]|uniref:hypothetical protein n=1 Tax=Actinoplanes sp. NPDC023936 TaxID=3154910 RepID=UPI0033EC11A0